MRARDCACVKLSTLAHMTATVMQQKVQGSSPENSLPPTPILMKKMRHCFRLYFSYLFLLALPQASYSGPYYMSQVSCPVINALGAISPVTVGLNDFISLTHASDSNVFVPLPNHLFSQRRRAPPRTLIGRRGVNAFMDMLRVPNGTNSYGC